MTTSPTERKATVAGPPPLPASSAASVQPSMTGAISGASRMDDIVIGKGVTSTGTFTTSGEICIDGVLRDAEVHAATLSVSHGGEFHGKALVRYLEVFGTLSGEVIASEQIVLRASARVSGKLSAPSMVMHRGAAVTGEVETVDRTPDMPEPSPRVASLG